jgi:hypothetical protein
MWQAETFSPDVMERELGWAEQLGFRTMRVFLHNLAWRQDPDGFLDRVDRYLAIADRHHLSTLLVFFDSCWDPHPRSGAQLPPVPGLHNSRWVQSPGVVMLSDVNSHGELEAYVKATLRRFKDDRRIIGWDLFNEPNNPNTRSYLRTDTPYKAELALVLLKESFGWARQVAPSQPLTAGVWDGEWDLEKPLSPVNQFMLENSDVISFHCYHPIDVLRAKVAVLRKLGRPMLCTEYMARPRESRFETALPFLKEQEIEAYNWGFIEGRSQTNYPWDSWAKAYAAEPPEWFHDVLHTDGTPYRANETAFLRQVLLVK